MVTKKTCTKDELIDQLRGAAKVLKMLAKAVEDRKLESFSGSISISYIERPHPDDVAMDKFFTDRSSGVLDTRIRQAPSVSVSVSSDLEVVLGVPLPKPPSKSKKKGKKK